MTGLFEFALAVALSIGVAALAIRIGGLVTFYWQRWRTKRRWSKLDQLSLASIARMGAKDRT